MRRATTVIGLVTAAVVATPSAVSAGPQDRVTGRGTTTAEYEARVNARSGADGQNPRGTFAVDFFSAGLRDQKVRVTCMVVVGDTAVVGGLDRLGVETFLTFQDNGSTGDLVSHATGVAGGTGPDQDRCTEILAGPALLPVVTGNFTVTDA
jgi:hypothetical protein